MTISELITQILEEANKQGISLESLGIYDDEDLQIFALRFLLNNFDDATFESAMDYDTELEMLIEEVDYALE